MELTEFKDAFNAYALQNKQGFSIKRINPPDDNEDGTPGKVCTFEVTDYIAGTIYVDAGEIVNVQTITKPGKAIDGAFGALFNICLIDVMTGWANKRRNKLVDKLGFYNGNFKRGKGHTVTDGGYRFKLYMQEGKMRFSLRVGPYPIPQRPPYVINSDY